MLTPVTASQFICSIHAPVCCVFICEILLGSLYSYCFSNRFIKAISHLMPWFSDFRTVRGVWSRAPKTNTFLKKCIFLYVQKVFLSTVRFSPSTGGQRWAWLCPFGPRSAASPGRWAPCTLSGCSPCAALVRCGSEEPQRKGNHFQKGKFHMNINSYVYTHTDFFSPTTTHFERICLNYVKHINEN